MDFSSCIGELHLAAVNISIFIILIIWFCIGISVMALRGAGIFLPLTFIVFFKGLVPKEAGFAAMIAGIMVACLWPFIFPDSANALFPSLAFNLLFLVPGVLWSLYKNKDRRV